jgi:hypothetical protein
MGEGEGGTAPSPALAWGCALPPVARGVTYEND